MAVGGWATAADFFEKALALSPDSAAMRHGLGVALFRMGDTRGAEEQFERIVRTTPSYRESYYNLAMIKAGSGRMEEALSRVSTALEHDPGYMAAPVDTAWVRCTVRDRRGGGDEGIVLLIVRQ